MIHKPGKIAKIYCEGELHHMYWLPRGGGDFIQGGFAQGPFTQSVNCARIGVSHIRFQNSRPFHIVISKIIWNSFHTFVLEKIIITNTASLKMGPLSGITA